MSSPNGGEDGGNKISTAKDAHEKCLPTSQVGSFPVCFCKGAVFLFFDNKLWKTVLHCVHALE